MTNSIKHLTRALCRALLAVPDLEPKIDVEIKQGGLAIEIDVDVFPYDFGPICGEGGTMKFAIQSVIAAAGHPGSIRLNFANTGTMRSPHNRNRPPSAEPLKEVLTAALNHWRKLGFEADGKVELSDSAGIVLIDCDPRLLQYQRAPFLRICRGIGKSNGFRAMAYIDKTPTAAR